MNFWELDNLSFAWPGRPPLLNGLSLSLGESDTVALSGPNGSGKTTLGKLMLGLLRPTAGEVRLLGRPIASYTLGEIGRRVGYVLQNPGRQLFCATVREEIAFGLGFLPLSEAEQQERTDRLIAEFDLGRVAGEFPLNLSQGEKQRVAIAAVLALQPAFLLLDEPTTGLDPVRQDQLASLLAQVRARGTGYLLISHDREFCRRCTQRTLTLSGGGIAWRTDG